MIKKLIAFDLDGTLTESRTPMDAEMKELFEKLLEKYFVAVISGGILRQFELQLLNNLSDKSSLNKLFILPANGTSLLQHKDGQWHIVFEDRITVEEKEEIKKNIFEMLSKNHSISNVFKEKNGIVEDKGGQISLCIFNPDWEVAEKKAWDPDHKKRIPVKEVLQKLLPNFEVKIGGTTTIDITRKGIDKGYAMKRILAHLKISPEDAVFVGDAMFPGGNDYAASLVVDGVSVKDFEETKGIIRSLL